MTTAVETEEAPRVRPVSSSAAKAELQRFRELVIASRADASVAEEALASVAKLNSIHQADPTAVSPDDARFLNVLRGYLGVRLAGHQIAVAHTKQAKRKGDTLLHCWRCETPVDERFTDLCPKCTDKAYKWRVCPVCEACGCQRAGNVLV